MASNILPNAFNACRCAQIIFNRNVFIRNPHLIILTHFLIYILPALIITIQILVALNTIIIAFCIRHVSSIRGIRSQQIINLRRKHKKTLLIQTIIFYSIWLVLWSPNMLAFQFINVNTQLGIYISLLNYIEITIDPIFVAVLDIRYFQSWKKIWRNIKRYRQRAVVAALSVTVGVRIFTTKGFHNSKNNVIYAEDSSEIPADLREAPMLKYPKGVMFWSGICTRGLILHDGPNNFTQWLQGQHQNDKRKRMYMIGELSARFLREEVIPTINKVVQNLDEVIFQDD
ncbi:unnamed protein product [Rotaria sordida]|uniref:G-protein coupled receptors family 1 profile domain-containing protein n=1 Tax=Rotaria sordida TaxID=392033 RepID=A0A819MY55_9BILA|nr:unnamed protein product [Rotaria sordida]